VFDTLQYATHRLLEDVTQGSDVAEAEERFWEDVGAAFADLPRILEVQREPMA
jgi:hypothetical protein